MRGEIYITYTVKTDFPSVFLESAGRAKFRNVACILRESMTDKLTSVPGCCSELCSDFVSVPVFFFFTVKHVTTNPGNSFELCFYTCVHGAICC